MFAILANIAYAQTFSKVSENPVVGPIITKIVNVIVIPLVGLLFVTAGLVFIWGIFMMITKGEDPSARKDGQRHMFWGIIGMFIMVGVYGIIRLIANTVGVPDPFL